MPSAQFNGKREAISRLEVEKALYAASEMISYAVVSSALPDDSNIGSIDLWELENKITQILTDTVNCINDVAPSMGEDLAFEIKRRRSSLVDEMVNLFLGCIKDAFGSMVEVEHTAPRGITVRLSKKVRNKDFINKEFKYTIYDVMRYLLGK